jgi:PAS domain S-box-containing protein
VTDGAVLERHDHLPPEPASASAARRLVAEALVGSPLDGTAAADAAVLLVSEVVSNAVLHAGTAIQVTVRVDPGMVRVEVRDGSVVRPSKRHFHQRAATGRGMELVDVLATAWGTEEEPSGKVVWFEVTAEPVGHGAGESVNGRVDRIGPMWTRVRLRRVPVALLHASLEYGESAMRELALLAFADSSDDVSSDVFDAPRLDLGPLMGALDAALADGTAEFDIELDFPPSAEQAAIDRLSAVDEAERLAADDRLLILPAVPEIALCRRWCLGQITLQLQGHEPTPWELPVGEDARRDVVPLSSGLAAVIDASTDGVVVADACNRIVHVNAAADDLLGWASGQLVGRRLTTIIPVSQRAAHLAGFTRFQLTGEGPLLDRTVRVPVLRRDGSVVSAVLDISVLDPETGGRLFQASFTDVDDG